MRLSFALVPLLISAPALAQPAKTLPPQPKAEVQVPPQLTDPMVADRLANAMQALSKAFLDLRVGELQAALEGRQATAADRNRKVRDMEPGIESDLQAQMAHAKPMVQSSMKALADALPSMMKGLQDAQKSLERATANMPDPTYPKR